METNAIVRLPARQLTLDDVAKIAASSPDLRYELSRGLLWILPPADAEHAKIVMSIAFWLLKSGLTSDEVLADVGVRVSREDGGTGRAPDLVVLKEPTNTRTVWLEPGGIFLAVEVVSPGSEDLDRIIKPLEYARAGIPHFWRVERAQGSKPTVHTYILGVDEQGSPAYVGHETITLDAMLAGPVPKLS